MLILRNLDEPDVQEELRQMEWDIKCEAAPKCSRCGQSIYPHDLYFEYEDAVLCEKCLDDCTHDISDLEVAQW